MCFVVTCWERADLLALICGVFCEFVTFPLVSWVRCGTWLYRFLIFATLLLFLLIISEARERLTSQGMVWGNSGLRLPGSGTVFLTTCGWQSHTRSSEGCSDDGTALDVDALCVVPSFVFCFLAYVLPCFALLYLLRFAVFAFHNNFYPLYHYTILLYTCALEIFAVKTTWWSKVLLLLFAFFAFMAPACQKDVITLQHKFCLTVFFPWFFKGRLYVTLWVLLAFTVRFASSIVY